ncbi:unnamed protein product [Cochlearia groenlandica]
MALTAQAPPPRVVSPRSVTSLDPSLLSPRSVSVLADIVIACAKRGRGRPAKTKSDSGGVSRKPSGRPRRKAASASVAAASAVKIRRGRPKRSLKTLSATEVVNGSSRKRKRSKNDDVAAATVQASANKKRGRKPKVVVKPVGRPKKGSKVATEAADTRELKKKTALLQKKVKEAADKLSKAVAAIAEVQAIVNGM